MGFYTRMSFRLFSWLSEGIFPYLAETKTSLRKARMGISVEEYMSMALMTCFIVFLVEVPALSFIFSLIFSSFLFGFITAFTASIFLVVVFFFAFINYPKVIIMQRAKAMDESLAFASIYLSTVSGSKLPLGQVFKIFSKFMGYEHIKDEVDSIIHDMEMFGFDINTAIERSIERTPSKNFKELLWGMLSTMRIGGDLTVYLKEKSKNFFDEYRRRLFEFSHTLTIFIEVYLTAIVLGAIFFVILTAVVSGVTGAAGSIILLQFFLIFVFLPLVSIAFIFLIKTMAPGGE